jgi:hypothetical protein
MDKTAQYCPVRRDLEERAWTLTAKLSTVASKLIALVDVDHRSFNATQTEWADVRSDLAESHRMLQTHRSGHGC